MKVLTTRAFDKEYSKLPQTVKNKVDEKLSLFMQNLRHPSLRVKKMQGHKNIWEGSITMQYRFTFEIQEEIYILRRIGTHEVLHIP